MISGPMHNYVQTYCREGVEEVRQATPEREKNPEGLVSGSFEKADQFVLSDCVVFLHIHLTP
jgi:hypothetical protein